MEGEKEKVTAKERVAKWQGNDREEEFGVEKGRERCWKEEERPWGGGWTKKRTKMSA